MAKPEKTDLSDAHTARPGLSGRKAIVTGGTTGIGRAIAVLLASEGVEVFICGRNEDHLADALERIGEVGKGNGIACDLGEKGEVERFFSEAGKTLGNWDIAIINAAVPAEGLADMDGDEVRYALAVDFTAYVMSAHRAVDHLQDRGDILFTGSYSTHKLGPGSTVYAGVKSGIHGFAEALRREVSQKGIKVGLVTPALTGSDFQKPDISPEEQADRIQDETMMRAEDIAVGVHFMLTQPRRTVVQEMVLVQRDTDA
ncbi:SDR family NAD(P)-dependent oxidoreductase [Altererythrobacter aurantiacus]|uniref:SDR family NAD(P)-dependent oxidoreductase n=2 Tax=Parapontixanthobacter aurantiacus TaxID=1463599 RepID=A0A844ZG52_9SPHN|nr:SDR family NAD(P)-dependent oxidoreductase [Parapontixanthobacter aurantiacus]